MRSGRTETPSPLITAFISAVMLIASHTGLTVKPAPAVTRSNSSLAALPRSRRRNFFARNSS